MNIIVVGNGMMGKERIRAINTLNEKIIAVLDVGDTLTVELLNKADWVFVCTPPDASADIIRNIRQCHKSDVKILVEKPYLGECLDINVGYNYRFLKGVNRLLSDGIRGRFGNIISVNMVLAMGDSPDAKDSWRLDPLRTGGGVMIDLGVHLIDLAMILSEGRLKHVKSFNWDGFWCKGGEEETHLLARDGKVPYNIQVSKVRWRSNFSIEVNGTDGYGIVEGRNRHFGNQTYRVGNRWAWMDGKSQKDTEKVVVNYDGEDSFIEETRAVLYGTDSFIHPATAEENLRNIKFIT